MIKTVIIDPEKEVSNVKYPKIRKVWNKTKKFIIPIGIVVLGVFAFSSGCGFNRQTVAKLQKLNNELIQRTEQLRGNTEQLERSLEARKREIAGLTESLQGVSTAHSELKRISEERSEYYSKLEAEHRRVKRIIGNLRSSVEEVENQQ